MKVLLFFILFVIVLFIICLPNKCKAVVLGGKKKKIECFNTDIWDEECLDNNQDLNDMLYEYETNKIGQNIRKFIKFYKSTLTTRCVIDYLLKNNFKLHVCKLKLSGNYISIYGEKTRNPDQIAPHLIFNHADHSSIRIKPIVGGFRNGYTPFPTISMAIIYDIDKYDFSNEVFKITRKGEPIPKAPSNHEDVCMNPNIIDSQVNTIMKTTHIRLRPPSLADIRFFKHIDLYV